LFKESSPKRLPLHDFKTVVSFGGIDFNGIVQKMPWSLGLKQIELSLTATGNGEIEIIFPDVLKEVNAVSDRDIKDFSQNPYLKFNKPYTMSYNETVDTLLRDFALQKLRHSITRKMLMYGSLANQMGQDKANELWANIEIMSSQVQGLSVNSTNVSVSITNNIDPATGRPIQGLAIYSEQNRTGYLNVTYIENIQDLLNDYSTYTVTVDGTQFAFLNTTQQNSTRNSTSNSNSNGQQGRPINARKLKQLTEKLKHSRRTLFNKAKEITRIKKLRKGEKKSKATKKMKKLKK